MVAVSLIVAHNVFAAWRCGGLETQMFKLPQLLIRCTKLKTCTSPAIFANTLLCVCPTAFPIMSVCQVKVVTPSPDDCARPLSEKVKTSARLCTLFKLALGCFAWKNQSKVVGNLSAVGRFLSVRCLLFHFYCPESSVLKFH